MTETRPEEPERADTPTEPGALDDLATQPVSIEDLTTQPVSIEDLATQPVSIEDLRTEAMPIADLLDPPPPANVDAPTELIADSELHSSAGPSTLDTVFGASAFVEHDDAFLLARRRAASPGSAEATTAEAGAATDRAAAGAAAAHAGAGMPRSQRILIGVAIGLGVLVATIAAFIIGLRLPGLVDIGPAGASAPVISARAEPSAEPTPELTPEPPPTEEPVPLSGPLAAGVYDWDALAGGECLEPYLDPWQEEFTVADCAAPHAAQLIAVGTLPGEEVSAYPGEEALAALMPELCRAPGVIDLATAAAYRDLQVEGSYAVSAEDWAAGERRYGCFVTRSSGEPLTGSLSLPLG